MQQRFNLHELVFYSRSTHDKSTEKGVFFYLLKSAISSESLGKIYKILHVL